MQRFNKLWVALGAAAGVGASVAADGLSTSDYFAIAAALFGALGVGVIANQE